MQYPFKGKFNIGTRYGVKGNLWKCGWHTGVDFQSTSAGGDGVIYPIMNGTVIFTGKDNSYGNYIQIKHPNGYVSLYAHLKTILVKKNMVVTEDVALGYEGATGNATGKHLHLEIHKDKYSYPSKINPLPIIEGELEVKKTIDIKLNGVVKSVTAIEQGGNNYVKLQDLRDSKIAIGYDSAKKLPTIDAK